VKKTVLIINADNYFYPEAVDRFLENTTHEISGLYVLPSFTDTAKHRAYALTSIRVMGLGFLIKYIVGSTLKALLGFLPISLKYKRLSSLQNVARFHGLVYKEFKSVNGEDFISELKSQKITTALSICSQIYREKILSLPDLKIFNLHPSFLPRNKGRFPFFWALYNKDKEQAVTCHQITIAIDEGPIVFQKYFELSLRDDVASLMGQFQQKAPEYLEEALGRIKSGNFQKLNDGVDSFYGPIPTKEQIKYYKEIIRGNRAEAGRLSLQSDASPSQPNSYRELKKETSL
jgi:hypothetical protein